MWCIVSKNGIVGIEKYHSEYDAQYACDCRNALVPSQNWQVKKAL